MVRLFVTPLTVKLLPAMSALLPVAFSTNIGLVASVNVMFFADAVMIPSWSLPKLGSTISPLLDARLLALSVLTVLLVD